MWKNPLKYLSWIFIIFAQTTVQTNSNLALNKPARQSSQWKDCSPEKAVDGIIDSSIRGCQFSKTNETMNQWWSVDLGDIYYLERIVISFQQNASDITRRGMWLLTSISDKESPSNPSQVWLLEKLLWVNAFPPSRTTQNLAMDSNPARYLALLALDSNGLALKEVQAFGFRNDSAFNVALGKRSSQSSQNGHSAASNAVNGVYNDFTLTNMAKSNWWKVELGAYYELEKIIIYNRMDCCAEKLKQFYVVISLQGYDTPAINSASWRSVWSQNNAVGTSLSVSVKAVVLAVALVSYPQNTTLSVAEVEVFGKKPSPLSELRLSALNQTCLTMSWSKPAYTFYGSPTYRYRCGTTAALSTTATIAIWFNLNPGKSVICAVSAEYEEGARRYSPEARAIITMPCIAPNVFSWNIKEALQTKGSSNSIHTNITWVVKATDCDSSYEVTIALISHRTIMDIKVATEQSGAVTFYNVKPFTNYTVNLTVGYRGQQSTTVSRPYTSMELAPSESSSVLEVSAVSANCVALEWHSPDTINGFVTEYKYWCGSGQTETTSSQAATVCGLSGGSVVRCSVRACNKAGCGPEITTQARTNCTEPSLADILVVKNSTLKNIVETNILNIFWKVNLIGCDQISEAKVTVIVNNQSLIKYLHFGTSSGEIMLESHEAITEFSVTVNVINSEGFQSATTFSNTTYFIGNTQKEISSSYTNMALTAGVSGGFFLLSICGASVIVIVRRSRGLKIDPKTSEQSKVDKSKTRASYLPPATDRRGRQPEPIEQINTQEKAGQEALYERPAAGAGTQHIYEKLETLYENHAYCANLA